MRYFQLKSVLYDILNKNDKTVFKILETVGKGLYSCKQNSRVTTGSAEGGL